MADGTYVKGLDQVGYYLREAPDKLARNVVRGGLRRGARIVQAAARQNVHSVSGKLAKGLKIGTSYRNGVVKATVRATGEHAFIAHIVEWTGAKPHTIRAKGNGWLYFGGKFVKEVDHPGIPKRPFLRPALDANVGPVVIAAAEYMRDRLASDAGLDTADLEFEEIKT